MSALKFLASIVATITAPLWIVPFVLFSSLWDGIESMHKMLWGKK